VHLQVLAGETRHGTDGRPVTAITVSASSRASKPVHPSFVTLSGVTWTPGWRIIAGPAQLDPGATATYRLESSDYRSALVPAEAFAVAVLVSDPASVGVSASAVIDGEKGSPGSRPSDASVPAP
jgi:hypothetical protein